MYDTLARLPIVVFEEISKTGDLKLLLMENETATEEELAELWQVLSIEFSDRSINADSKRTFGINKIIEELKFKYKMIAISIEALRFDWDNELVGILRGFGYTITQVRYYDDLERIERESKALLVKAANLEAMLPKPSDGKSEATIYDVLASYSAVLGIDFDFEALSCLKYISMQKQVASKIKASEQNAEANKPKKRR